jgi:hypothetical protein
MGKNRAFWILSIFVFLLVACADEPTIPPLGGTPSTGGGLQNLTVRLSATPAIVNPNSGQVVTVTAFVSDGNGSGVGNAKVQLAFVPRNLESTAGSLSATLITTSASGSASTTFVPAAQTFVPQSAGVSIVGTVIREDVPNDNFAPSDTIFVVFTPLGTSGGPTGTTGPLPTPVIDELIPLQGPTIGGILITVRGSEFVFGSQVVMQSQDPVIGTLQPATVFVDAAKLQFTLPNVSPSRGGPISLFVQNPDGQFSNTMSFTYIASATVNVPTLSTVDPSTYTCYGAGNKCRGVQVLLIGDNFHTDASIIFVALGGTIYEILPGQTYEDVFGFDPLYNSTPIYSWINEAQIRINDFPGNGVILCGASAQLNIYVSNQPGRGLQSDEISGPVSFTYGNSPKPSISAITPGTFRVTGDSTASFVISGEGFLCDPVSPVIYFGTQTKHPVLCSPTSITGIGIPPASSPTGGSIDVIVEFPSCSQNASATVGFTYE